MGRFAALCLLLLALPQDPADKVRTLVEKLCSEDIDEREGAGRELTSIGFPALPALREAARSSKGAAKALYLRFIDKLSGMGAPVHVTLEATDRPLREIAAELERQTLLPIRLIGTAADSRVTVAAKNVVVWKVVEDICRAQGELMYRFVDDTLEIYPSKFRSLPVVDAHGMRFFLDRFIWEGAMGKHPGWLRIHGGVLVPRGARVVWVGFKVDELTDDQGIDWAKEKEYGDFGGMRILEPDGFQTLPTSRSFVYPFYLHRSNQPPPNEKAAKIARYRGRIKVVVAEGLQRIVSIPAPLSRSSTQAGENLPSLGIPSWKVGDGRLLVHYLASWNADSERDLWHRVGPLLILNQMDGSWQAASGWYSWSKPSPKEVVWRDSTVSFSWPVGSEAESLELVGPHPLVNLEIPFDFRDLPLR